jgi:hypothetical protein
MTILTWDEDLMGSWLISANAMCGPGFGPRTLELLWTAPPLEIANQPLPGIRGDLARTPVMPSATHAITMRVAGGADQAGDPHPSIPHGIAANYAALCEAVGTPETWGGPTVGTTVARPDGVTLVGDIQAYVGPLSKESGGLALAIVTVTIPYGALVVAPPP